MTKDTVMESMPFEPGASLPTGMIPLSVPELNGNEWKYVRECLDTNWVSSAGPFVERFEQVIADYVGARHAVAVCNGTAGLHIALLVAGIEPNDEVLVSALTFIAPANAIRYAGAWPVFIDAEPRYWQMDPQKLTDFLEKECNVVNGNLINKTTKRRVKAVLPVHILGHPCDMEAIVNVARKFDLAVIEDASESLGAEYNGTQTGRFGDIACFSFNGNKVITSGGGGMIVTDNEQWATRARYLTTQAKDDPVEYIHKEIGYNYRLTNIQAALGCAQMERLPDFIERKRSIAGSYREALESTAGIGLMQEAPWARSIYWMYTVLVDQEQYGEDWRALMHRFASQGIQTRPLWQPLNQSLAHSGAQAYAITVADRIHNQALSLPSSVGLTELELQSVADVIKRKK